MTPASTTSSERLISGRWRSRRTILQARASLLRALSRSRRSVFPRQRLLRPLRPMSALSVSARSTALTLRASSHILRTTSRPLGTMILTPPRHRRRPRMMTMTMMTIIRVPQYPRGMRTRSILPRSSGESSLFPRRSTSTDSLGRPMSSLDISKMTTSSATRGTSLCRTRTIFAGTGSTRSARRVHRATSSIYVTSAR